MRPMDPLHLGYRGRSRVDCGNCACRHSEHHFAGWIGRSEHDRDFNLRRARGMAAWDRFIARIDESAYYRWRLASRPGETWNLV